jgi:hypothetical protein
MDFEEDRLFGVQPNDTNDVVVRGTFDDDLGFSLQFQWDADEMTLQLEFEPVASLNANVFFVADPNFSFQVLRDRCDGV